jgi:hypothetical protein
MIRTAFSPGGCPPRVRELAGEGHKLAGMKRGFWSSVLVRKNPHTIVITAEYFTTKGGNGCH